MSPDSLWFKSHMGAELAAVLLVLAALHVPAASRSSSLDPKCVPGHRVCMLLGARSAKFNPLPLGLCLPCVQQVKTVRRHEGEIPNPIKKQRRETFMVQLSFPPFPFLLLLFFNEVKDSLFLFK